MKTNFTEICITVDGGTTNTRLSLVRNGEIIDTLKYGVGACLGCSDKEPIYRSLRNGIDELCKRNSINESDISCVIASGMITSEGGLYNLPHLIAPVTINDLASSIYKTKFSEITDIPFYLIRGVKTAYKADLSLDMMRGEETELFGLSEQIEPDSIYLLPGSHTKIIYVDSDSCISGIHTSLSGEMMNAVLNDTILKNSISFDTRGSLSHKYLISGYNFAKNHGVSAAFFKVRVIDKQISAASNECFSFFLGAALQGDVDNVITSTASRVIIGGKRELREPLSVLIRSLSSMSVIEVDDSACACASVIGAMRIYRASLGHSLS